LVLTFRIDVAFARETEARRLDRRAGNVCGWDRDGVQDHVFPDASGMSHHQALVAAFSDL
jgi:hypothetical protein